MRNALIRNSIQEPEHRELSGGVRQRKESVELALEQLLEIVFCLYDRRQE